MRGDTSLKISLMFFTFTANTGRYKEIYYIHNNIKTYF